MKWHPDSCHFFMNFHLNYNRIIFNILVLSLVNQQNWTTPCLTSTEHWQSDSRSNVKLPLWELHRDNKLSIICKTRNIQTWLHGILIQTWLHGILIKMLRDMLEMKCTVVNYCFYTRWSVQLWTIASTLDEVYGCELLLLH